MVNKSEIGAKGVDFLADKAQDSEFLINRLSEMAYVIRKSHHNTLQPIFDWLSEPSQRKLLRADDKTFVGKFIEKWAPQADPREYMFNYVGISGMFSMMANLGVIDVKDDILKDMRGLPGTGLLEVNPKIVEVFLSLMGMPELKPLFSLAHSAMGLQEGITPKVRAKVLEKTEAAKVTETQHNEEIKEMDAAGIPIEQAA